LVNIAKDYSVDMKIMEYNEIKPINKYIDICINLANMGIIVSIKSNRFYMLFSSKFEKNQYDYILQTFHTKETQQLLDENFNVFKKLFPNQHDEYRTVFFKDRVRARSSFSPNDFRRWLKSMIAFDHDCCVCLETFKVHHVRFCTCCCAALCHKCFYIIHDEQFSHCPVCRFLPVKILA
jgi:hypothetical protein